MNDFLSIIGTLTNFFIAVVIPLATFFITFATFFVSFILPRIKKLRLKVYLFQQYPLTLFYSPVNGSYLTLRFTIQSINKESVIENIKIILERDSDNKTLELNWSLCENPNNIYFVNPNNSLKLSQFVRPTKINANSIEPFIIEFLNNRATDKIFNIYSKLIKLISYQIENKEIENSNDFYKTINYLIYINEINDLLNELFYYSFWKEDIYTLNLHISYNNGKIVTNKFDFKIKDNQNIFNKNSFIKFTLEHILSYLNNNTNTNNFYKIINISGDDFLE